MKKYDDLDTITKTAYTMEIALIIVITIISLIICIVLKEKDMYQVLQNIMSSVFAACLFYFFTVAFPKQFKNFVMRPIIEDIKKEIAVSIHEIVKVITLDDDWFSKDIVELEQQTKNNQKDRNYLLPEHGRLVIKKID